MSIIKHRRGAWVNQYAQPPSERFLARARQVDYVIIKYGLQQYERLAHAHQVPWLAERMGESATGDQSGPSQAVRYGRELAAQAMQPGCVGAVINLEEADGGWHLDDGAATRRLIEAFRANAPGRPLFASLDTRGNRPRSPYQRVCAELCEGVMPMVYPQAFGQPAAVAFAAAINPLMRDAWAGKEIHATYQAYGSADVPAQVAELSRLDIAGIIQGANAYTLGHATDAQWSAGLTYVPAPAQPAPPAPDVPGALRALRTLWVDGWHTIEQRGTVAEAAAFAEFWRKVTGT